MFENIISAVKKCVLSNQIDKDAKKFTVEGVVNAVRKPSADTYSNYTSQ